MAPRKTGSRKKSAPKSKARKTTKATAKLDKKTVETAGKVLLWVVLTLGGIIFVDLLVQYYNNSQAAIVNGTRVSYAELDERLRQTYATEILENLVNEELVKQKSEEEDIKVSEREVDNEYQEYLEGFPEGEDQLIEQLESQGLDKEELLRRIEVTLTVNKLVKGRVKQPTEEELKEYYDLKFSYLEEDKRPNYDEKKAELKEELYQSKLQAEIPTWLEEVRSDSSIQNNHTDKPKLKFLGLTISLVKKLFN